MENEKKLICYLFIEYFLKQRKQKSNTIILFLKGFFSLANSQNLNKL